MAEKEVGSNDKDCVKFTLLNDLTQEHKRLNISKVELELKDEVT